MYEYSIHIVHESYAHTAVSYTINIHIPCNCCDKGYISCINLIKIVVVIIVVVLVVLVFVVVVVVVVLNVVSYVMRKLGAEVRRI